MSKIIAIRLILKAHNYIVITEKGYVACTPKFGHKRYWDDALELFKELRAYADDKMSKKVFQTNAKPTTKERKLAHNRGK